MAKHSLLQQDSSEWVSWNADGWMLSAALGQQWLHEPTDEKRAVQSMTTWHQSPDSIREISDTEENITSDCLLPKIERKDSYQWDSWRITTQTTWVRASLEIDIDKSGRSDLHQPVSGSPRTPCSWPNSWHLLLLELPCMAQEFGVHLGKTRTMIQ